jgi:hypothetical protein
MEPDTSAGPFPRRNVIDGSSAAVTTRTVVVDSHDVAVPNARTVDIDDTVVVTHSNFVK